MPTRTSFQKRQKELQRLEKAREKVAKRQARKAAKAEGVTDPDADLEILSEDAGEPQPSDNEESPS
jgi:hypothetical protein